jgi:hypothetical protein
MSVHPKTARNQEICDRLTDAAKKSTSRLNSEQIDRLCTVAAVEITNADVTTTLDQVMATIDESMAKFILKSTKPKAICDSANEIKKIHQQVAKYDKKLKQVMEDIAEEDIRVEAGRMSRSNRRFHHDKREELLEASRKPLAEPAERWELKRKLVLAYDKYKSLYNGFLQQDLENKSAHQIAADIDDNFNNNNNNNVLPASPLREISQRIENNNNIARGNSNSNVPEQAARGEQYLNRIKETALAKKQEEAEMQQMQKTMIESFLKKNERAERIDAIRLALLEEKLEEVREAKRRRLAEKGEHAL